MFKKIGKGKVGISEGPSTPIAPISGYERRDEKTVTFCESLLGGKRCFEIALHQKGHRRLCSHHAALVDDMLLSISEKERTDYTLHIARKSCQCGAIWTNDWALPFRDKGMSHHPSQCKPYMRFCAKCSKPSAVLSGDSEGEFPLGLCAECF